MIKLTIALLALSVTGYSKEVRKPCCKKAPVNQNTNTITVNQRGGNSSVRTVPVYNSSRNSNSSYSNISNISNKEKTYINQSVKVVKVPEIKVIKLRRTVTKYRTKKVPVIKTRTLIKTQIRSGSYIGLLLGQSKTFIKDRKLNQDTTELKTKHENDIGLEYKYLFKNGIGVGIQGTVQENYYLTLGLGL